jgi:uncharacterized protein
MSETLPIFPLSTVLFPGMRLPLHIFEERYRTLAADLLAQPEPRRFGVLAIRKGREVGANAVTALHEVGCIAVVREVTPHADGRYDIQTVGTDRFRLLRVVQPGETPYFRAEIEIVPDTDIAPGTVTGNAVTGNAVTGNAVTNNTVPDNKGPAHLAAVVHQVQAGFRAYLNALADRGGGVISVADLPDEPALLSYVVGAAMIIDLPERQSLLAAPDALSRLRLERSLLSRETGMLRATTSRPAPDYSFEQFSPN